MYTGTNATALRSMDWLASALAAQMQSVPYARITVRSLCRAADLSRQTFYNVFDSKDEVVHYCLQREYNKVLRGIPQGAALQITDIIDAFLLFCEANRALLDSLIQNQLEGVITEELARCISLYVERFVSDRDSETMPYAVAMLSGALAQLELFCFKQAQPLDHAGLAGLLADFFDGRLYLL